MLNHNTITEELRSRGYRLTTARASVARALCDANSYMGAYDIYNTLKAQGINVGVASIYRVLSLLCELNLVQREEFGAGGEKFRLVQGGHTHRLVCSGCGTAREFTNCGINSLAKSLEQSSGFTIHDHWLKFFGICPDCRGQISQQNRPSDS